jgi:hypothetical protein
MGLGHQGSTMRCGVTASYVTINAKNASTLYLTVEEHLTTFVALMMPRAI